MSTQKIAELCIPRETVNDDTVTLLEWRAADGEIVSAGQTVAIVETSKSVLDLAAPCDGVLRHQLPANSEVAIGAAIGTISAGDVSLTSDGPSPPTVATSSPTNGEQLVSESAQRLIDDNKVDLDQFKDLAMIRSRDVFAVMKNQDAAVAGKNGTVVKPDDSMTSGIDAQKLQPVDGEKKKRGGLFADARRSAGERGGKSVFWLACNYFYRNWFLGLVARVSPRGVINFVHRRRGVKMGKSCYIDPTATLETAYPENVTMGNDVRIAAGAAIMTHIKAPNYHRDHGLMPVVIKPVVLEDHVFIGVNAVILPGVRVGKAAVVASGAVVSEHVPDHTMVAGAPARVIKRFPVPETKAE